MTNKLKQSLLKKSIFKFLSLNNKETLIGSSVNDKLKYKTDYDLQEEISKMTPRKVLEKFQEKYIEAKKTDNIYIVDFKSGLYNTIPIKWDYETIMQGYQMIESKTINFMDTLNNATGNIIKIDLIVFYDNEFHEFSCNYYVYTARKDSHELYKSLLLDVKKYYFDMKYMKMLKRIYSYLLIKQDVEHAKELETFFNSKAGLLYQLEHKVNVLIEAIDNNVSIQQFLSAIEELKKNIPVEYKSLVGPKTLNKLSDILHDDVNIKVAEFLL